MEISCFIITKNEEQKIARAINSVKDICSEIIVIDSGSTDNTVKIAESLGAYVILNEWPGYLKQKIYGESLCKNKWILNIDADEEITEELQKEIISIKNSGRIDAYKAYTINLVILYRDEDKPRLFAPSNKVIRLYNKEYASFKSNTGDSTHDDVKLHQGLEKKASIFDLHHIGLHRSGTSIAHLVNKANFYSTEQSIAMNKKGRKSSPMRLVLELPFWIFKAFFVRRYFIFGLDGFVDSVIFAFARFIRLAKLRELERDKKTIK